MARRIKEFWIPYCDDLQGNVTVWRNEGNTVMKGVERKSIPSRLFEYTFPYGPSHEDYKVVSRTEGHGINKTKSGKIEAELPVTQVESFAGKRGTYSTDLLKRVELKKAELYLGVENGPLFVLNPDGSCALVACCLPDEFAEAI